MKKLKNGSRVRIKLTLNVLFSENASENKKNRFFQTYKENDWRIWDIGSSNTPPVAVIVNEEGLYITIPVVDIEAIKRIYICGPITGIPNKNIEAFDMFSDKFKKLGYEVINPHRLDHSGHADEWAGYMKVDLKELIDCDVLGLMFFDDWRHSKGDMMELFTAHMLGIQIINVENEDEIEFDFTLEYSYNLKRRQGVITRSKITM